MNKAQIVKDEESYVYLKVEGKPLTHAVYFKIEEFITPPEGKLRGLSKGFLINLKGGK